MTTLSKDNIVYKGYLTISILGEDINLISDETSYGLCNVAEIKNIYHYLDNDIYIIDAAILLWQDLNRDLSLEELSKVMIDNKSIYDMI